MATTATGNYVSDNSTLANFVSWATAIASALQAFGWVQSADTGQVMWTNMSISAASWSGATVTYTYSGLTGLALAVGRALTITGMTHSVNNLTAVITGLGAGTFTITNPGSAANESGSTGVVTRISAVPSGYVYEIWTATDAAASTLPIFLKMAYGNSTSSVQIQVTPGTSSNGSGTITGGVVSGAAWLITNFSSNQGGTTFPCYFSGNAGEFRMYMWQSTVVNCGMVFGIERSKNASGNVTSDYFTALCANSNTSTNNTYQQTVLSASLVGNLDTGVISFALTANSNTGAFNGTVACFPVFPILGYVGNPMLGWMSCMGSDIADGATVTVDTLYGGNHTFIGVVGTSSNKNFGGAAGQRSSHGAGGAMLMRYE